MHVKEGAKLILQPTPNGWMKYVQCNVSHLMQCMTPTLPPSHPRSQERVSKPELPLYIFYPHPAPRPTNDSVISATSSSLRHVSTEGIHSSRCLGRGVRMNRKFGRRKQGEGLLIRTWLSMPYAVLWLCRATSFNRFQGRPNQRQASIIWSQLYL